MRKVRYSIGVLLFYLTLSQFFQAFNTFDPNNYLQLIVGIFPIVLLDGLLIWVYIKGSAIYGTNNSQKGRWFLISALIAFTILMSIYCSLIKTESNFIQQLARDEKIRLIQHFESKLDSCEKRK